MGGCGAGVKQGKLVLDKAKDVEQVWQYYSNWLNSRAKCK